jgi:disulfide bond formation protein DsbB
MDARTGEMTAVRARPRLGQWLALAVPGGLLLGALGSQHLGGLAPCEMCFWQRWAHLAAVAIAGASFLLPRGVARAATLLAALAIAVSGAIGLFHAGVEQGWWEGLTSCATTASGQTADELLKSIMAAPVIRCDQIAWSFLGLSMAALNALISLFAAGGIAWLIAKR